MALSTGWTSQDRLAPIPIGRVPAHLRPTALGEAAAKPAAPKLASKPAPEPASKPTSRPGRPPRRRELRHGYAAPPPAPGIALPGLPAWPRQAMSEAAGLTLHCRDRLCRRRRRCRHDATTCWIALRREFEERLARMSDARRAGLYRRAAGFARRLIDISRMLDEMHPNAPSRGR